MAVTLGKVAIIESDPQSIFARGGHKAQRSGEIADRMGAKVTSLAPVRSSLIRKGMLYSPAHGDNAFTVPLFEQVLPRVMPT